MPCVVSIELRRYSGLLDREERRSAAIAAAREACNRPGSHAARGDSTMIDSVLPAARLDSRRCVLLTLAVAAELVLHGCRIRQARAYPGLPAIEIEPPRRGLFETYARTVPSVAGIAVPIRYATILHGVRVTWTSASEPRSGSRSAGASRRERLR
jgi:hypothetical protein